MTFWDEIYRKIPIQNRALAVICSSNCLVKMLAQSTGPGSLRLIV